MCVNCGKFVVYGIPNFTVFFDNVRQYLFLLGAIFVTARSSELVLFLFMSDYSQLLLTLD